MNFKKILNSKYKDLSEEEKRQSRLIMVIVLSIFIFILPWIFATIFLGRSLISEFKKETIIGLLITIGAYIRISMALIEWTKKGPQ